MTGWKTQQNLSGQGKNLGDYKLTLENLEIFEKMPPFLFLSSIKSFDSLFFLFFTMLYDPKKLSGRLEVAPIVKNNFEGVEMVILSTIKIKLKRNHFYYKAMFLGFHLSPWRFPQCYCFHMWRRWQAGGRALQEYSEPEDLSVDWIYCIVIWERFTELEKTFLQDLQARMLCLSLFMTNRVPSAMFLFKNKGEFTGLGSSWDISHF